MHDITVLLLRKSQTSEQLTTLRTNEQDISTTPAPELKKILEQKKLKQNFWVNSLRVSRARYMPSRPPFAPLLFDYAI